MNADSSIATNICCLHIAYDRLNQMKSPTKSDASGVSRRGSTGQWALKPQDVVVALKLLVLRGQWLPYAELGKQLRLSQFEAYAVKRLLVAKLVTNIKGEIRPINVALKLFIYHGAPYAFPPVRGK